MISEKKFQTKNQHYVPKFYLRNFSLGGNGREIRLFNPRTRLFVNAAPIKSQASSNYYYGEDGEVEAKFSQIEGIHASTIRNILHTREPPKHVSAEHFILLTFAISTESRNPVKKKILDELNQTMASQLKEVEKQTGQSMGTEYFDTVDSLGMALSMIKGSVNTCLDLHMKLIINETKIPFITSDNPVVKYNQFLEGAIDLGNITGFGMVGFQMFIPLSESIAIMFYDEKVYYVGERRRKEIRLTNQKDVNQLNLLQLASCHVNVYGGNAFVSEYIFYLTEQLTRQPDLNKVKQHVQGSIYDPGGQIVMQTVESLKIGLSLSFVYLSTFASRFKFTGWVRELIRDRELKIRDHREQMGKR